MESGFPNLTPSSEQAFRYAYGLAEQRPSASQSHAGTPMTANDLLLGIMLSHDTTEDSEVRQLLEHFRLSEDNLYKALNFDKSLSLSPVTFSLGQLEKDGEVAKILKNARDLAEKFNPKPDRYIRLKDLFGGVLMTPSTAQNTLKRLFSGLPISFDKITTSYPQYLEHISDDRSTRYADFLKERFSRIGPLVAGYSADIRTERDLVNITSEVDAFAYLICAKTLNPPLAIGLFGDWGAGKSFFMESLRKRVYTITSDARASGQPQGAVSVFKSVAQIEFNAWHYVEGDLWASLVEHIFRNLQTPSSDTTLLQQRRQAWLDEIQKARRSQQETQDLEAALQVALEAKRKAIRDIETERDKTLAELSEVKTKDVVKAIILSTDETTEFTKILGDLGITPFSQTALDFMDALRTTQAQLSRGNTLLTSLQYRSWTWVAGLIAVVLSGPLLSWLLPLVSEVRIPWVTNALASLSVVVTGVTVMLKGGSKWLAANLTKVEAAQTRLESKKASKAAEYAQQLRSLEQTYAQQQAEYAKVKEEEAQLSNKLEELEQGLKKITPGQVLYDFISERIGSEDYRKRLGVAALIRRDFEQLSTLVKQRNDDFIRSDDGKMVPDTPPLLNRVVLYIDDLDRCPPERVVKVLQAVHLFMAFELFVVVVAVDARWLSQSLRQHYRELLSSDPTVNEASPEDYLEKIFQVPFWVQPLDSEARGRMIQGLLAASVVSEQKDGVALERRDGSIEREPDANLGGEKDKLPEVNNNPEASADSNPAGLDILQQELDFMHLLKPLLGNTPRAIKRFANIYRLVKVMYLAPDTTVKGEVHDDFREVLLLLALLTGLPTAASHLFEKLEELPSDSVKSFDDLLSQAGTSVRPLEVELGVLKAWLKQAPKDVSLKVQTLKHWTLKVMRFSFHREFY